MILSIVQVSAFSLLLMMSLPSGRPFYLFLNGYIQPILSLSLSSSSKERGEVRGRERERNISTLEIHHRLLLTRTHNPAMCPDWELNWQTLHLQAGAQFTEPHQPGHTAILFVFRQFLTEDITHCKPPVNECVRGVLSGEKSL